MSQSRTAFALIACAVVAAPAAAQSVETQAERLSISGYGNLHWMDRSGFPRLVGESNPNNPFFQLREFSLFLDADITEDLTLSAEIELGDNLSEVTGNYAYLDYHINDYVSVRAGKVLVPFLHYNENKANWKQFLMSPPFTAQQISPVNGTPIQTHSFGWSDAGVTLTGVYETESGSLFDLKLSFINGLQSESNILDDNTLQLDAGAMQPVVRPRDGLLQNRDHHSLSDNNDDIATNVKLSWRAAEWPLDLGLSWYRGKWDNAGERDLYMYGLHVNYLAEDWALKGELAYADVDQQAGIDPGGPALNISTGDYDMYAWYLEGSIVPFRWDDDRYLRLVARYDEVDTNDEAAFTPFDRHRITLGTEWQFTANSRLRFEWQYHRIHSFQNAPQPYVLAGGEEDLQVYMASVIFWF